MSVEMYKLKSNRQTIHEEKNLNAMWPFANKGLDAEEVRDRKSSSTKRESKGVLEGNFASITTQLGFYWKTKKASGSNRRFFENHSDMLA